MSNPNIFISFDLDHDEDLCKLLIEQSADASLGFRVSGRSKSLKLGDLDYADLRRAIRKADQIIIICGEHTSESVGVLAELHIAQEEKKPYFMIWGRRESMCTKPEGAKSWEGMYGWTYPILREQITLAARKAESEARTEALSRARR